MEYVTSLAGISPVHLEGFFVGWPTPPSPVQHWALLRGSTHIVLALDGDKVVGFINALSDGVLSAYIPLLEVRPEYQGTGVGSELVRRALDAIGDLYMIDLVCDEDLMPFYERFGMFRWNAAIKRSVTSSQ
jgi:ribosomal protein S18 acetylase RimI-like enzyme